MDSMRVSLCLASLLLAGCPGDDGSGDGNDAADVTSDGQTSSATATSVATDDATSVATADGTGTPACGDVADEETGPSVTVEVINARAEGVWMPLQNFCYSSVPYVFTGPDGAPVPYVGPDCGTCESYAAGSCACPGAACSEDVLMYLEPGAVLTRGWSGVRFVSDELPETCEGVAMCGSSCQRAEQAPAGSYAFEVMAGSSASGCMPDPCTCEPFEGVCTVFDPMAVVDDPQPVSVAFDYPSVTSVQITIE